MSPESPTVHVRLTPESQHFARNIAESFGTSLVAIVRSAIPPSAAAAIAIREARFLSAVKPGSNPCDFGSTLWTVFADGLRYQMVQAGVDPDQVAVFEPEGVYELWISFLNCIRVEAGLVTSGGNADNGARFGMNGDRKQIVLARERILSHQPFPMHTDCESSAQLSTGGGL